MTSVIIATYNRPSYLRRAIDSVLAQEGADYEIVVVDDASSTHEAHEVCSSYGDPRIKYYRHDVNKGVSEARNTGIRHASGDLVTFLDDDDEFCPDFFASVESLIQQRPDADFGWMGRLSVWRSESGDVVRQKPVRWAFPKDNPDYTDFIRSLQGGFGYGLWVKRHCFSEIGLLDTALGYAEDTDLILRLARRFTCVYTTEPLYKVNMHDGERVSANIVKRAEAYEVIAKKHEPYLVDHPDLRANLYYRVGWLYSHVGNRSKGVEYLKRAVRNNPRSLKFWTALLTFASFGSRARAIHGWLSRKKQRAGEALSS